MRRNLRKSFARPLINYLSTMVLKDVVAPVKEKVDNPKDPQMLRQESESDDSFANRRKTPEYRRKVWELLGKNGFSDDEKRRFRDWSWEQVMDLIAHKEMDDRGLAPEWIADPMRAQQKVEETKQDYLKVGIHKDPESEPLLPEEASRLNEYYKTVGKPQIRVGGMEKYKAAEAQTSAKERQPVYNSIRKAQKEGDQSSYDSGLTPDTDPDRYAQGSTLNSNQSIRSGHKQTKKLSDEKSLSSRKNDEHIKKADDVDSMVRRQNQAAKAGNKVLAADLAEKIGRLRRNAGPSEKDLANKTTGDIWRQQKESLKTPDVTKSLISRIQRITKATSEEMGLPDDWVSGPVNEALNPPDEIKERRRRQAYEESLEAAKRPDPTEVDPWVQRYADKAEGKANLSPQDQDMLDRLGGKYRKTSSEEGVVRPPRASASDYQAHALHMDKPKTPNKYKRLMGGSESNPSQYMNIPNIQNSLNKSLIERINKLTKGR